MVKSPVSFDKIKAIWHTQVHDEQNWEVNKKVVRAVGLFVGSVIVMRNYGDLMAI